ncbi:MAG: SdpI family protein [Candidatus Zophobacter franzmannii]|nr:SdpI family protein [Candidatus Zophobacter franzmannii]
MKRLKQYFLCIGVILLQILVSLRFIAQLGMDYKIPTHWNIKGQIDGWMGIGKGSMLFIGLNLFLFLLLFLLPYFSPKYKAQEERFEKVMPQFAGILAFFFGTIHIFSIYLAKYPEISEKGNFVLSILGIMFIAIGNLLPKIPQNFFAGIRTPWTLSSEDIWRKTHRLGGRSFVFGGIFVIFASMFPHDSSTTVFAFIIFMACALLPAGYSFILFKKEGSSK